MSTPLLLFFDGYLSEEPARVDQALKAMAIRSNNIQQSSSPDDLFQTISCYLDANPHIAAIPSVHDGSLPLHFAASLGNVAIAELIWKHHPTATTYPNSKGKIPIHYAAREGRAEMVHWFLQIDPHSAEVVSGKSKLALHFACGDGHLEIVQALLTVYPEGARMASVKGKLPLHYAARWGHLAIARELIQVYPAGARALDWEGSLPLHECAREGQYHMARFLVDQYPMGLLTANLRSEIPLFPAVRSANLDLLCYMVQTYPAGACHVLKVASPLEWGLHARDIVELLLRAASGNFINCPLLRGREAPAIHFHKGAKILDMAKLGKDSIIDVGASDSLPTLAPGTTLIESANMTQLNQVLPTRFHRNTTISNRKQAKKRKSSTLDPRGRKRSRDNWRLVVHHARPFLPLHAALECGASFDVVDYVVEYLGGRSRIDELARWPLHVAMTRCAANEDPRLIELVKQHLMSREAVMSRDFKSGCLPLHIALDNGAHVSIIERLLEIYPQAGVEACRSQDEWVNQLPILRAINCDLSVIYAMLRFNPGVLSVLVSDPGNSNR